MPDSHRNFAGLPGRWLRNRLFAAAIVFAVAAAVTFALRPMDRADRIDANWLNVQYSVREWIANALKRPYHPDADVAIIGIDPKSDDDWKEPSFLWGPHFARVLKRLRLSGARVVVFDYIPSEDPTSYVAEKWKDTSWQEQLLATDSVVWAKSYRRAADGSPFLTFPYESLLFATKGAGENGADYVMGFAEFPRGQTVVTSMRPVLDIDKLSVSLAARAVERYYGRDSITNNHNWSIQGHPAIPLRQNDSVLLNLPDNMGYVSAESYSKRPPFLRIPMYEFEKDPNTPDPRLNGKIVLIGDALPYGSDRHNIPFATSGGTRQADGVEIQAAFIRTLLRGRFLRESEPLQAWAFSLLLIGAAVCAYLRLGWLAATASAAGLALAWIALSAALFCMASTVLPTSVPLTGLLIAAVGMIGFITLSEERERRQVLSLWGRYQDPRLVDYLLRNPDARGGEGEETQVTVLFADLVSFTQTVEKLTPRDALSVLNRYLALIEAVVLEQGGIIDKYLGDGLMAQWGAPAAPSGLFRADHARAAVSACLEIQRRARQLELDSPESLRFGLRLTLHSGPVIFGWVGASRLEFTIIGDTVNVTSRLQETAKQLDSEFLVSEATYDQSADLIRTGRRSEVPIRGRIDPLTVFEVIGPMESGEAAGHEAADLPIPTPL